MDNNDLRSEYAGLHAEASKLIGNVAADKREMSAEEREQNDKRFARMDVIRSQWESEKKLAQYAFESDKVEFSQPKGKAEFDRINLDNVKPGSEQFERAERDAINLFLRTGETNKFTITSGTNSVLIPKHVLPPIQVRRNNNAFRAMLGAFGLNPIETSDTSVYTLPLFDDSANVGRVAAEDETTDTKQDIGVGNGFTLGATLYDSKSAWFSNTMLNAVGFDVLAYVTPILQRRVDKTQEQAFTTTLGGVTPYGTVTTASKSALTYNELLNWEHSLPPAYRSDAGFIVSDSLFKLIRGMVDNQNRPIMDTDPQNVFQYRLHGKPIFISDYLGTVGTASAFLGAFVSASSIAMRDVVPSRLTKYVNIPSQPDQTGLRLFQNGDCQFGPGTAFLKGGAT